MQILNSKIQKSDLKNSKIIFDGPMVKAVVDVDKSLVAIDADLHADLEQLLLLNNSSQDSLWGINLYFEEDGEDFIEFDSMINVRPRLGNRSRSVESEETQAKIREAVSKWIS